MRSFSLQPAVEIQLCGQLFGLAAFAPGGAGQEALAEQVFFTDKGQVVDPAEIAALKALFDVFGDGQSGTKEGRGTAALADVFRHAQPCLEEATISV